MMKLINLVFLHSLIVGALPLNGDGGSDSKQSTIQYSLAATIPWAPVNATSVDQSAVYNGTYYLSDRNNFGVHVIDLATNKQRTVITGGFAGLGTAADHSTSGPNGLVVLPERNELYVGDTNGTVRVVNLLTNTIMASIQTGSTTHADEFGFDPESNTVVVTNPEENPPFISIIAADTRKVTGHIIFNNASGLEQPAFNSHTKRFYISVPSTDEYPGGAIAVLDESNKAVSQWIVLDSCNPAGIVFGPEYNLFVGCSSDQILTFNLAYSLVIDVRTSRIVGNITGLSGIDQVAYNPNANLYYATAYQNQAGGSANGAPTPQLGIVDARRNTLVQTITTDNATAHSVGVDPQTNKLIIPIKKAGIEVYDLPGFKCSQG
jgi:hypothetical protein